MAGDRAQVVVRAQPLHRLGWPDDDRLCLGVLDRQRLDDLDLGDGEAVEHAGQLVERLGARLHADALAALAVVVELERVVLGGELLEDGRRRGARLRRLGTLALEEVEGHGASWVDVAGRRQLPTPHPTSVRRRVPSHRWSAEVLRPDVAWRQVGDASDQGGLLLGQLGAPPTSAVDDRRRGAGREGLIGEPRVGGCQSCAARHRARAPAGLARGRGLPSPGRAAPRRPPPMTASPADRRRGQHLERVVDAHGPQPGESPERLRQGDVRVPDRGVGSTMSASSTVPASMPASARALRIARTRSMSTSTAPHPRPDRRAHAPGAVGPVGDDQQVRVAGLVRQALPDRLGDEGHDRVQQSHVAFEHPGERPPGRRRPRRRASPRVRSGGLGELQVPVAVLAPDRLVEQAGDLAELVVLMARRTTRPRWSPRSGRGSSARPGRGQPGRGQRQRGVARRPRPAAPRARSAPRSRACCAKFRAPSSLARPSRTSAPGATPLTSAKRRASAPISSMIASGSIDVALRLRHLLARTGRGRGRER